MRGGEENIKTSVSEKTEEKIGKRLEEARGDKELTLLLILFWLFEQKSEDKP